MEIGRRDAARVQGRPLGRLRGGSGASATRDGAGARPFPAARPPGGGAGPCGRPRRGLGRGRDRAPRGRGATTLTPRVGRGKEGKEEEVLSPPWGGLDVNFLEARGPEGPRARTPRPPSTLNCPVLARDLAPCGRASRSGGRLPSRRARPLLFGTPDQDTPRPPPPAELPPPK